MGSQFPPLSSGDGGKANPRTPMEGHSEQHLEEHRLHTSDSVTAMLVTLLLLGITDVGDFLASDHVDTKGLRVT